MEGKLKRLPAAAEFLIVILLAFGWFIFISLHRYFSGHWGVQTSDSGKLGLVVDELVLLALAGTFLWARGWSLERIGLKITWRDTAIGVGMGLGLYLFIYVLRYALWYAAPPLRWVLHVPHADAPRMSLWVIVAVLAVNSVYEEVFASGYVLTFLKERFGSVLAVNAGLFLRLLYHLYQGVGAIVHVVPIGLVFGIWYVRTRRLWPLIVAHGCINAVGYLRFISW